MNICAPDKKHMRTSALVALIFLTTGCVTTSETPLKDETAPQPPSSENSTEDTGNIQDSSIASTTITSTEIGSDLQIDIRSLERFENDILLLQLGVINNSPEAFDLGFRMAETSDHLSGSNISLIDEANQKRHISLDQSDGKCFCGNLGGEIPPGESADLWVTYPAPEADTDAMTILTPITPPLTDIPISESSESLETGDLGEPQILTLTAISDSLEEDQTGRTESSEEVSVILSSDVLFETNSSTLNEEAAEILEQVSQEIDDASASVVSVDGHADNTGNNSINLPLSEERAESVESTLVDLISREDVSFEVTGHGSADPIADNETEEGRERNRRVSVTFEK